MLLITAFLVILLITYSCLLTGNLTSAIYSLIHWGNSSLSAGVTSDVGVLSRTKQLIKSKIKEHESLDFIDFGCGSGEVLNYFYSDFR
jgi:hypothetical protein